MQDCVWETVEGEKKGVIRKVRIQASNYISSDLKGQEKMKRRKKGRRGRKETNLLITLVDEIQI